MAIRGGILGVTAFIVGLVVTFATAGGAAQQAGCTSEPLAEAGGRFVRVPKAAGWTFLYGPFVGTGYPGGSVGMVGMANAQYVYLLPVLLWLGAGGILAQLSPATEPRAGLLSGMTPVAGYLPKTVIFAALSHHANVQPSLLRAVVVAGVVSPNGLGAICCFPSALLRWE